MAKTPHNHYDYLRNVDEVLNERADKSGLLRFVKQFSPNYAETKRNEDYTEFFNTYHNEPQYEKQT